MVILLALCIKYFLIQNTFPAFLFLLHACIHVPHSFKYHINYNFVNESIRTMLIKNDMTYMFISHILIHASLSSTLPILISIISIPTYVLCTLLALRSIQKSTTQRATKDASLNHAWLFLMHYFPLLYSRKWWQCAAHFGTFIVAFKTYKALDRRYQFGSREVSVGNACMHIGLLFNTLFGFKMIS